jgi:hypothetical protein
MQREFKLQAVDLMYRERMGGPDAPFGLDFDLGSRFAWAKFIDRHTTSMMVGPNSFREESDFFAVGPRIGLKPYWTFDNSSWRMTLYAQGNASFLWSNFKNKAWVNDPLVDPLGYERLVYSAAPNGFLWNFDGEAGFSMFVPGLEGILQLTGGYRYELWNSSKMGFITESGSGTLTNHGPFLRLQISF